MDKSWAKLPKELLHKIFQILLARSTLLQLQLTCKTWSQVAYQEFYKNLSLFNNPETLTLSLPVWASSERLVLYSVRKLCFDEESIPDAVTLSNLVRLCPLITEIQQHSYSTVNYFPALLKLREEGYLQHLQLVEAPFEDSSQIQDYNTLMLGIASTAKELTVFSKLTVVNGASVNTFPLLNHISSFIHLEKLHFYSDKPLDITEASSTLIQGNHPYLKQVAFLAQGFSYSQQCNGGDSVGTLSQVDTVEISSSSVSNAAVEQAMTMFPKLKKLNLTAEDWEFDHSSGESEENAANRFFETIAKIKEFEVNESCSIPQNLLLSFRSLAKSFDIGKVHWYVDSSPLDEESDSEMRIATSSPVRCGSGKNTNKPSADVYLHLDTYDHDSDDYLSLLQALALNTGLQDLEIITDGDTKIGKLLHYITVNTLPNYDTKDERRQLETLELHSCKISSQGFAQISKRLCLVKHLLIEAAEYSDVKNTSGGFFGDDTTESETDDDDDEADEAMFNQKYQRHITMPHTAFERITLRNQLSRYAVQIKTASSAVFYVQIDEQQGVEKLSAADHCELMKLDPAMPIITITCSSVSAISTRYGSLKLDI
ncbi:hypothetical protein MBANPS3_005359 [Mucor bainieri]